MRSVTIAVVTAAALFGGAANAAPSVDDEQLPLLKDKFKRNIQEVVAPAKSNEILGLFEDDERLQRLSVSDFMQMWVPLRARKVAAASHSANRRRGSYGSFSP